MAAGGNGTDAGQLGVDGIGENALDILLRTLAAQSRFLGVRRQRPVRHFFLWLREREAEVIVSAVGPGVGFGVLSTGTLRGRMGFLLAGLHTWLRVGQEWDVSAMELECARRLGRTDWALRSGFGMWLLPMARVFMDWLAGSGRVRDR